MCTLRSGSLPRADRYTLAKLPSSDASYWIGSGANVVLDVLPLLLFALKLLR